MFAYQSSGGQAELGIESRLKRAGADKVATRLTGRRDTSNVLRRLAVIALVGVCAVVAACGESDDPAPPLAEPVTAIPGDADPEDVRVIDEWAKTLAAGDVEGAAEYFAIPSVAENGPLIEIADQDDALRFNASLPCGAELIRAETEGDFTTATFRLTERPGPGTCGAGTGGTAQTAFVIEEERIVEWRRVGLPGGDGPRRAS